MDEVRPLEKFYFQNRETKKYYIVGAYDLEHAYELLSDIDNNIRFTLEAVDEEDMPET